MKLVNGATIPVNTDTRALRVAEPPR